MPAAPPTPRRHSDVKAEDADAGAEAEFTMPVRLSVLEDTSRALDGHYTIDAVTDVAALSPADQLATLQAAFHALGESDAPTSIREHDIFDVLYSFVKALPDGTVTKECRGLLATELATALHKLARMISRLCQQRRAGTGNIDDRRFARVAVISRSCVRMLTLLLHHTLTAPPRHRDSNGEDGLAPSQSQQARARQRQRRARAGANLGHEDTHGDGVDVAAKEATLTGFIESLAVSSAEIWGNDGAGPDEATCTAMLKTALHLLSKQAALVGGAGGTARGEEDPVVEGLLFLLKALAAKFTKAYDAAVSAATAAAPAAPAAAAADDDEAPAGSQAADGSPVRRSARVVVAAAHPKHVLISPLVELLLLSVPPTSSAATAPLPRLVSRLLGLVHGDADDEEEDQYGIAALAASTTNSPTNADPPPPPPGADGAAMTSATSWSAKFVSWTLEAVAQAAVSGDISGDGNSAKNVAALLEDLARNHVTLVANHAPLVMPVLHSDSYEARKAAITAIVELVVQKYTGQQLGGGANNNDTSAAAVDGHGSAATRDSVMRDRYLEDVMARLRDLNPFVRSHTLKKWASLVENRAVPKHLHVRLTREAVDRVIDRHYHVRRAALMLLESILKRGQWFHSTVSERLFRARLVEHATALEAKFPSRDAFIDAVAAARDAGGLGTAEFVSLSSHAQPEAYAPLPELAAASAPGDDDDDAAAAAVAPPTTDTAALERVALSRVVFYQSAVDFAALMGIALKAAVDMLASRTQMDVMQAIHFIAAASDMKLDGSAQAVAKMLTLIYFHDQQTQFAVCEAFVHIFFDSFNALKVSPAMRNLARVHKLVSVLKDATDGEVAGIERILLHIRGASSTAGVKPPPFVSSVLATINEAFLDSVWALISSDAPAAGSDAGAAAAMAADANDKRAALQLYVLITSTVLPRDVAARKATILAAMRANATRPRFCALALDALARESGLRGFTRLDTSPNSAFAMNPHGHAVLSAAVHQLARPTRQLNQWLSVATSAVACIHQLCSHPAEVFLGVVRHIAGEVESATGLSPGGLATLKKIDASELPDDTSSRLAQLCFVVGHTAVKQLVTVDTYERAQLKVLDDAASGKNAGANTSNAAGGGDVMQKELGIGGVDYERAQLQERCTAARVAILNPKGATIVSPSDVEAAQAGRPSASTAAGRRSGRASGRAEAGRPSMTLNSGATRINVPEGLWGKYAPLIVRLCSTTAPRTREGTDGAPAAATNYVSLRAVAATALLKLMVCSEEFCGQQLRLVFTLLSRPTESWQLKTNVVIGLGDVACVHANTLAPYMKLSNSGFYALLADTDVRVRAVTIQVCTHLVLNDMLRVMEHLQSIVRLVADPNEAIRHNAQLFVQHLAVKMKHNLGNVIAPLVTALSLPSDRAATAMASQAEESAGASPQAAGRSSKKAAAAKSAGAGSTAVLPPLQREEFQAAVGPLLEALSDARAGEKERRAAEALIGKLCDRFPAFYSETDETAQGLARNVAFALGQLNYTSEKMMKKLMSEACYAKYRQWLRDGEVHSLLQAIATKARRAAPGAAARQAAAAAGEQATGGSERRDRATIEEWERRMQGDAGIALAAEETAASPAGQAGAADGRPSNRHVDAARALVDASTDEDDDGAARARPAPRGSAGARSSATSGRSSARSRVKREASSDDDDDDESDSDDSGSASGSDSGSASGEASEPDSEDDDNAAMLGAKKKATKSSAKAAPKTSKKPAPKAKATKSQGSSQAAKKRGGKK